MIVGGFRGLVVGQLGGTGTGAAYTPAIPDDWIPVPTTVDEALDQLGYRTNTPLIYRPTEPSSYGNVFNDWNDLYARFLVTRGPVDVWVDSPGGVAPIPPLSGGGSYDFENRMALRGYLQQVSGVEFQDGATVIALWPIISTVVVTSVSTTPVLVTTGLSFSTLYTGAALAVTGPAALVEVSAGDTFLVVLVDASSVASLNPGVAYVFDVAATGVLNIVAYTRGALAADSIMGAVGATLGLAAVSASANLSQTQPAWLGTVTVDLEDRAEQVEYTPTTPADWLVPPDDVAEGLDELASRVAGVSLATPLTFGAICAGGDVGKYLMVNGNPLYFPITGLGVSSQMTCDRATVYTKLAWNSTAADATTDLKVWVNGASVETVPLNGTSGVIALTTSIAALGDKIAIEFDAGTAPGEITVTLAG